MLEMITKAQLTNWRHRLIRAQELYTQAYRETQDVIREILKEEESYGITSPVSSNNSSPIFKPTTKVKGDPLAELTAGMTDEQRTSLLAKLQQKETK